MLAEGQRVCTDAACVYPSPSTNPAFLLSEIERLSLEVKRLNDAGERLIAKRAGLLREVTELKAEVARLRAKLADPHKGESCQATCGNRCAMKPEPVVVATVEVDTLSHKNCDDQEHDIEYEYRLFFNNTPGTKLFYDLDEACREVDRQRRRGEAEWRVVKLYRRQRAAEWERVA